MNNKKNSNDIVFLEIDTNILEYIDITPPDDLYLTSYKIYFYFKNNNSHKIKTGIVLDLYDDHICILTTRAICKMLYRIKDRGIEIKCNRDRYNKLFFFINTSVFAKVDHPKLESKFFKMIANHEDDNIDTLRLKEYTPDDTDI